MSFRHILPIAVAVSLSGCSLTTSEQHQQTLAAIEKLDTSINTRVVQLEDSLQEQKQQITQLESRLTSLSHNLEKMRQDHAKIPTAAETRTIVKERLVPMPVHGDKAILGQQEWVWIDKVKSNFRARVDTGAATSSLNAVDLQEFERDGKKWVRFSLAHDENEAKEQQLSVEAPVAAGYVSANPHLMRQYAVRSSNFGCAWVTCTKKHSSPSPTVHKWISLSCWAASFSKTSQLLMSARSTPTTGIRIKLLRLPPRLPLKKPTLQSRAR